MHVRSAPRIFLVGLLAGLTAVVAGCGSVAETPLPTAPAAGEFSVSLLGAGNAPATGEHRVDLLRMENDPGVSTSFTYLITSARKPPISYLVFPLPAELDSAAVLAVSRECEWVDEDRATGARGLRMGGFGPGKAKEVTVVLAGDLVAVDGEIAIKAANTAVTVPFQAPDIMRAPLNVQIVSRGIGEIFTFDVVEDRTGVLVLGLEDFVRTDSRAGRRTWYTNLVGSTPLPVGHYRISAQYTSRSGTHESRSGIVLHTGEQTNLSW